MMHTENVSSNITICEVTITPPDSGSEHIKDITVMCMLSILSVIGTFGNGLVIYVYSKKRDKLTSNVFILALAMTDFITSLLIMPYTVVFIYLQDELVFDPLCKFYFFLITSNVPLSAFIMVAIAVDRYLCICHPFRHLMTVPRAKGVLMIQLAFAGSLGLITMLMYSVYQTPSELYQLPPTFTSGRNVSKNFFECKTVYTGFCYHTSILLSADFTYYYQKVYSSFFLISLLLVFTLYIMIYKYVTSRRAKRQKQKNAKKYSTIMVQTEAQHLHSHQTQNDSPHSTKVEVNENGVSTLLVTPTSDAHDEHSCQKRKSVRERKDHNALANIKTAIMLFVVAVVFILAFLPAWLMALLIVDYVEIVFYSYFVYNVVNPFIYAFMNPTFRTDLQKVFGTCLKTK